MTPPSSRDLLIITSLSCEAAPLRDLWHLTPLREDPIGERFQVFHRDGVYVAISGIGKVRSAIATSALLTWLTTRTNAPIVANVGIAGLSKPTLPLGSLVYVHKVRDVATNTRLYPDVILKHNLPERSLETHDHPVTTPPTEEVLVDMEGSGFMQAVTALASPSSTCLLKLVSDYANGTTVTPESVATMVATQASHINTVLSSLRQELPGVRQPSPQESALLAAVIEHASLSLSQRVELTRRIEALSAQGIEYHSVLHAALSSPITSKDTRNTFYHSLLHQLSGAHAL